MRLSTIFLTLGLAGSFSCIYSRPAREPEIDSAKQTIAEKEKNKDNKESKEKRTEGYNYCQVNDSSDSVSRYLAGEDVPAEKVFSGDLEKLKKLELKPFDSTYRYEILLVPVGYEQSFDKFGQQLIINLDNIFKGLNIHFSSLDQSVLVSIERVERYAFLTKVEEAEIIKEKTLADKLVFVLNVGEYMGSGGNNIVISGNSSYSLFLAAHETGHGLGLSDGYERYYQKLNRSELFLSIEELEPRVWEAYNKILPPINDTGNHCNGRKVFTFYTPNGDLMDKNYSDEKLIEMTESGQPPFNPLQTEVMRSYIKDEISNKIMGRRCISNEINSTCSFFINELFAGHL